MIVIVALDDKEGMMFHKRRQSQDQVLRENVLNLSKESLLWMNEYTAKQFDCAKDYMRVDASFLDKAGLGEYCFVEDQLLSKVADQIEEMIVFRWNRRYPGDVFLDVRPHELGMTCVKAQEFAGTSHEKITMEIWQFLVKA